MKEWLEIGFAQVNGLLKADQNYQELLQQLKEAEEEYIAIRNPLTPDDQEKVEDYIALCEEIGYQKMYTAYYCGKRNG